MKSQILLTRQGLYAPSYHPPQRSGLRKMPHDDYRQEVNALRVTIALLLDRLNSAGLSNEDMARLSNSRICSLVTTFISTFPPRRPLPRSSWCAIY